MLEGYDIVTDLCDGLEAYLEEQGVERVADLCGRALANVVPHAALDADTRKVSSIDLDTCTRCGKCAITCRDAGYQAITEAAERTPVIDEAKCDGCGLCVQVCPVWDCMKMKIARVA
jgi:dihydropyrimidine dehydrogenase (NAD+) subunit PreA